MHGSEKEGRFAYGKKQKSSGKGEQTMGRLKDKVALITGSSYGLGKAAAVLFAGEGARVVVVGRTQAKGEDVVAQIQAGGGEALFAKADVSQSAEVQRLIPAAVDAFGRIDILVNNAGVQPRSGPLAEQTEEDWDRVVDTNLKGYFLLMKYTLPQMVKQGGGVIVNVSSAQGLVGVPNISPYAATKGGIITITKTAAIEYARHNIRINCVAPGMIRTPMLENMVANLPADSVEAQAMTELATQLIPLGRIAEPEEIAPAILFLASDESRYMTGAVLVVDGGYAAQ